MRENQDLVSAAMAPVCLQPAAADGVRSEFLDAAYDPSHGWDPEKIREENEMRRDVRRGDNQEQASLSPTSPAGESDAEDPLYESGDNADEILDRADSEGMVCYLVQVGAPTDKSKVHLPYIQPSAEYPVVAAPQCGAHGKFCYLKADETLVIGPHGVGVCLRCVPMGTNSCGCLCSHMSLGDGAQVYRCSRRCSATEEGHAEHRCNIHV